MKKFLTVLLIMAFLMLLGGTAYADDSTEFKVDWNGGGWVGGTVTSGNDAFASFESFGASWHGGSFTARDANNNPFNYGVDTNHFSLQTNLEGGGYASLFVERLDAKEGGYGPAGQQSYTGVWIADGDASLSNRSRTNYADMIDSNYGWQNSNHVTVNNSSLYEIDRWMNGGTGNSAGISALGSGSASLTAMSSEAKDSQVRLGWGAGCYTNAKFNASGSGALNLWADSKNTATTAFVPGLSAEKFNILVDWTNGSLNIDDYATTAK